RTAPLDPPRRVGPGEGERDPPGDRPFGRRGRDLPAPGPRDRPERAVRVYGDERALDPGGLSGSERRRRGDEKFDAACAPPVIWGSALVDPLLMGWYTVPTAGPRGGAPGPRGLARVGADRRPPGTGIGCAVPTARRTTTG